MAYDFKTRGVVPFAGYKVRTFDLYFLGNIDAWVQVGQSTEATIFSGVLSKGFALNKSRTIMLDVGLDVRVVTGRPVQFAPAVLLSLVRF
jgi:hypothetical protein